MKWNWESIELAKLERAKKVKLASIDKENRTAECVGSSGEKYMVSLTSCTCGDFIRHRNACKHMIRLAIELGILNESGNTEEQQRDIDIEIAKNYLAAWYGWYYLFDSPIVSDNEYDALKKKLTDEYDYSFPISSVSHINSLADPLSCVRIYLDSQNYEYIDKSQQGGGLYFFDEKAADVIKAMGFKVSFAAEGTRSTKHRPAWYLKADN